MYGESFAKKVYAKAYSSDSSNTYLNQKHHQYLIQTYLYLINVSTHCKIQLDISFKNLIGFNFLVIKVKTFYKQQNYLRQPYRLHSGYIWNFEFVFLHAL